MRILVGTLYCGESQFDECVRGIQDQTWRDFEHFVVRDLPNRAAHEALYRRFMEGAGEFDIFLKVDADMVIENGMLFTGIVEKFRGNADLELLEIAVRDFFSDEMMWGMNAYRNTMTWSTCGDDFFVDYPTREPAVRLKDDSDLAPAAVHCENPAPFHAFHFGAHRALKVVQPDRLVINEKASREHWRTLESARKKFAGTSDTRVGLAVLGAELAWLGDIDSSHIDYTDSRLKSLFERYKGLNADRIRKAVCRVSRRRFGFMSSEARYRFLIRLYRYRALCPRAFKRLGLSGFFLWALGRYARRGGVS